MRAEEKYSFDCSRATILYEVLISEKYVPPDRRVEEKCSFVCSRATILYEVLISEKYVPRIGELRRSTPLSVVELLSYI